MLQNITWTCWPCCWMAWSQRWVCRVSLQWGGRVGVFFGVEQDCFFLTFPLLFFLSNLGHQTGKVPRATGDLGSKQWVVSA